MTTLQPRAPYTEQELHKLYPPELQLQLVQVLLRHGERSPVSARFRNAGLHPYWPYCNAARRLSSVIATNPDASQWTDLQWRRRLETFGPADEPILAAGPKGEVDGLCQMGELTDLGRATTLALGSRLRKLYVDQLGFMPKLIAEADMIYLRSTPIPRALESVQQTFTGLYPLTARTASFPTPTILTRTAAEETLFPNDANCQRFRQLSRAFAQRTANRWNESQELAYVNKLISKWMPSDSPRVAVDSHPRLSGVMDTINSTLAHGPETRLPSEFYDRKSRENIERIGVEEWFSGFQESEEYRRVGIGGLVGDIVSRMVGSAFGDGSDGLKEVADVAGSTARGRGGESRIRFALSGCHDTTLAALLSSIGTFHNDPWPPYTSHVAVELFKSANSTPSSSAPQIARPTPTSPDGASSTMSSFWNRLSSLVQRAPPNPIPMEPANRKLVNSMTPEEQQQLDGYYVRIRYNDRPLTVPGCRTQGSHLPGDESFCTLAAFKRITDKFASHNWKEACESNLGTPAFPEPIEEAGY